MENGDGVSVYKQFIEQFARKINSFTADERGAPFRLLAFHISPSEVEAECLEWIRRYLSLHDCPSGLISRLTRAIYSNFEKSVNLSKFYKVSHDRGNRRDDDDEVIDGHRLQGSSVDRLHRTSPQIEANRLLEEVVSCAHHTVKSWNTSLPVLSAQPLTWHVRSYAIKNTRRKMEDRHIVIPDLNGLFDLKGRPSQSYFAIFDGHCGIEAAEYAATHLHCHLVKDPLFDSDPELAMKRAYKLTDVKFLEKAKLENLKSGATGLSALLRGSDLFVGWLGDSQAVLVRSGNPVEIMNPHKPEREDERSRIESLGGCVLFNGTWRVNGSIAVSRAIGDSPYKPYISSDADVVKVSLTGDEEYLILACDGLWDVLSPPEAVNILHKNSQTESGLSHDAAVGLVNAARDLGSSDNISVIVVLLKPSVWTSNCPSEVPRN